MTEIERILDQLKRAYEGEAWHGPSVREVLAGITAEQAHARPVQNVHSIWELVHHIAVWENVGRRRLQGDRAQIDISSPEDWPPADDTSEAAWEQAKAALDRGHKALRESYRTCSGIALRPADLRRHVYGLCYAAWSYSSRSLSRRTDCDVEESVVADLECAD